MRALEIIATHEGQTAAIAHRIAERMTEAGVPTDIYDVTKSSSDQIVIDSYDAVVVGTPLHFGHHDSHISGILNEHCDSLKEVPTAFFTVSLGIISDRDLNRTTVKELTEEFLDKHRFQPDMQTFFAGALKYSKYNWLIKRLMHWIVRKASGETSMDKDYEYTDWPSVDDFANRFAHLVLDPDSPPIAESVLNHPNQQRNRTSVSNRLA